MENIFHVVLLDPREDKPKHVLYFGSKLKGGNENDENDDDDKKEETDLEFDFENIDENKLQIVENKLDERKLKEENYFKNVHVYPEDSFWTLKQKIYVATGIPIYRQHVFIKNGSIHQTAYSIVIQDNIYPINKKADTKKFIGLHVDMMMYTSRDTLQIRTEEPCTLIEENIIAENTFYMYDLRDYLEGINPQDILMDNYHFNIVYYCVIKKYFPVLDESLFKLYLTDETKLISILPLLNTPKNILQERFNTEHQILRAIKKYKSRYESEYDPMLSIEIVGAELICNITGSKLMIRNLIDILQTSSVYVAFDAYISSGQSRYRVIKYWLGLEKYILDQILKADEDYFGKDFIVIYIFDGMETHNLYIYEDSHYKMVAMYPHTHNISFHNILEITKEHVDPIINIVNSNTNYLFSKLAKYELQNIELDKIHMKVKWDKSYNEAQFAKLNDLLVSYFDAGIFERRTTTPKQNMYMIKVVKGIERRNIKFYLKKGAETRDYFIIFKDPKINDTWNSRFMGENIEIINTLVSIIFELHNMTMDKFRKTLRYIYHLIHNMSENIPLIKKEAKKSGKKKKFKDIDPELYDFEDEKGTKYARICQKKHRPVDILTQEQYDAMADSDKKYVFPFINYTTGEPVYYKCTAKLPYFGFIVNKHPKGYCIPKCKESDTEGIKNKQIWNLCTSKMKVEKDELQSKSHNENILKFGKIVNDGQFGFTHDMLHTLLDVEKDEFLIIGYPKNFDQINGGQILDIMAFQLELSPENIIEKIRADLTETQWMSLASSNVKYEDFMGALDSFKNNDPDNQLDWTDTFVEIAQIIFGVYIVIFDTNIAQAAELLTRQNSSISLRYTNTLKYLMKTKSSDILMCFIAQLYGTYYPINNMNESGIVKLFSVTMQVGQTIRKIINKLEVGSPSQYAMFEYNNLKTITKIEKKYIWLRKIMYVQTKTGAIIGCYNSINFADGVEEQHTLPDFTKMRDSTFKNVMNILGGLISEVPIFICYSDKLFNVKSCEDCKIIGCRVGKIYCWFEAVSCSEVQKKYPKFNVELMNYNPYDVNTAIVKSAAPEQQYLAGIYKIYYNMYIYKIFKYEFYKLLSAYRKTQKTLIAKFERNELLGYIQANKKALRFSYSRIEQILRYSDDKEAELRDITIVEDILGVREEISQYSAAKLRAIMADYIVQVAEPVDVPIENIIYSPIIFKSCKVKDGDIKYSVEFLNMGESLFYRDGKLKVCNIDELLALLQQDLNNELLFTYEISNFQLMFIINYLNFRNFEDEKIIIQSL